MNLVPSIKVCHINPSDDFVIKAIIHLFRNDVHWGQHVFGEWSHLVGAKGGTDCLTKCTVQKGDRVLVIAEDDDSYSVEEVSTPSVTRKPLSFIN